MKKSVLLTTIIASFAINSVHAEMAEPSVAKLHAYKVVHHADYLKETAKTAGGTNKLMHTTSLPTEGTDAVVTPALDHLYSKAVIDVKNGPVVLSLPKVKEDRYFSIMITDQEHYVIYDEIRPHGDYVFVKYDYKGKLPQGKVIKTRSDFPHLFVRTQIKTPSDRANSLEIQKKVTLKGKTGQVDFNNAIKFTFATHDIYPQNEGILSADMVYGVKEHKALFEWSGQYFANHITDNAGMFGPIDSDEKGAQDPRKRAAAIIGHLGLPVDHAYYTGIFNTCEGERLTGDKPYKVTLPYENNIEEFWSVTRYSAITRNTLPNKQDIYNAYNTKPDSNGNVEITFSIEDPKDGSYWMPVNAGEPYYYVERFYGPKGKVITTQDTCK